MTTPFSGDDQEVLEQDSVRSLALDFTVFYVEEEVRWLRYALGKLRNRADAEDAMQDAGIRLYEKWDRALGGPDVRAVQAFAWKLVRDAVADTFRRRGRADAKTAKLIRHTGPEGTGHEPMDQLVDRDALRWALEELATAYPVQAEVVRLRQLAVDYPTIALVCDIAPSTARTYYSLGTRHMEYLLDPRSDHQGRGDLT
ncbi:RNA polymerase sigma factor [Kitasatospora sp. NPDC059811]|uniref:RNA polymerase sigma factor n=1 Tax=Streptomycetaceae TaxID=2062 RepID=UPI0007AF056D|nr:sigma-70 family RNA polymerase sigma factor [Streptomyces sp. MJM8645]